VDKSEFADSIQRPKAKSVSALGVRVVPGTAAVRRRRRRR